MKNKKILIYALIAVVVIAVLAIAFFAGGDMPEDTQSTPPAMSSTPVPTETPKETTTPTAETPEATLEPTPEPTAEITPEPTPEQTGDVDWSESQGMEIDPETGKDEYGTDPVPEGKPAPVDQDKDADSEAVYTCTIYITCSTLLNNMDLLDSEKHELVPEDGVILPVTEVEFTEGEDVFELLHRVCKENKIHLEFSEDPVYNTAYVEGLNNIYEFDAGELSGWHYSANGWFPNYGSSRYALKDGDVIEWHYSCEMGYDIEGYDQ